MRISMNRLRHAGRVGSVLLTLAVAALPCRAETWLGEERAPVKKLKVVKSLMEHRRRDVREQEAEQKAAEAARLEAERPLTDAELNARHLELLAALLKVRMNVQKVEPHTSLTTILELLKSRLQEQGHMVDIAWVPAESATEVPLTRERKTLSGLTCVEVLEWLCIETDSEYAVRKGRVELFPHRMEEQTSERAFPYRALPKYFSVGKSVGNSDERLIRIDRHSPVFGAKVEITVNLRNDWMRLRGTARDLARVNRYLDEVYHKWIRTSEAKRLGALDPKSKEGKLDAALSSVPLVPVEFPAPMTYDDVEKYIEIHVRAYNMKPLFRIDFVSLKRNSRTAKAELPAFEGYSLQDALARFYDALNSHYVFRGNSLVPIVGRMKHENYHVSSSLVSEIEDMGSTNPEAIRLLLEAKGMNFPEKAQLHYLPASQNLSVETDLQGHRNIRACVSLFANRP